MLKIFGLGTSTHEAHETHETHVEVMDTEVEPPLVVQSTPPQVTQSICKSVAKGPARPLHLVYCDEKGKFRMDPEAVAALQLVKGPVGVVSVCGRARQGKSFILNQVRMISGHLSRRCKRHYIAIITNNFFGFWRCYPCAQFPWFHISYHCILFEIKRFILECITFCPYIL